MPTFQEIIDIQSVVTPNILEIYNDMVDNEIYSEVTIPSPIRGFVTSIKCFKFNFPKTLQAMDIGDPMSSIFREENLSSRLNIDFNIHTNLRRIVIYNKNIINKDFMDLFAPNIKYKYVYCTLNNEPLNLIIIKLYIKYFKKNLQLDNKISHVDSPYIREINEYISKTKQGKEFCKIIKEELVSVAFHPNRICPMIMKYGPEIVDSL